MPHFSPILQTNGLRAQETLLPPTRHHLDVTGTFCPLPILLSAREMRKLQPGDLLEVLGDDPGILEDMPVWCERAGHRLMELREESGRIISLVEKGTPRPLPDEDLDSRRGP